MWRSRFNEIDPNVLLSFELSRLNLEVRPSSISGAGNGLFATRAFAERELVGYFYGTLVYEDLSTASGHRPSVYGEGSMAVPVKEFQKWCLQLRMTGPDGNPIWIYPAPFCAMRYINDARYLVGEPGRPTDDRLAQNPHVYRQNNVEFFDPSHKNNRSDIGRYTLVRVRTLSKIKAGDELLVDYGSGYNGFDL